MCYLFINLIFAQSPDRIKNFEEERPDLTEYYKIPRKGTGNDTLVTQKIPKDIVLYSREGIVFDYQTIKNYLDSGKVIVWKFMSNPSTSVASSTFNTHIDKNPTRDTVKLKDLVIINIFLDKPKKEERIYKKQPKEISIEEWITQNKRKNLYNVVLSDTKNIFLGYDGKKVIKDLCQICTKKFPYLLILSDGLIKNYSFGVIDFEPVFYYEIEMAREKYLQNKK
ncbi:MAG: hypothetical protein EAZ85_14685 [Bacteroidetes bacterium]|nr:MAG: hypothetical protein EAZ85_14685 [Bacteroidota bacterium]